MPYISLINKHLKFCYDCNIPSINAIYAYYDNQPTNPGLCKRPHLEVFVLPLS